MTVALRQAELDAGRVLQFAAPEKMQRLTLLVDPFPGGNVAFFPAVVVEFKQNTSGRGVVQALWPDGRSSAKDERHFVDLESMAGTSLSAFIAGPKTLVIAPEPTLKKMRSKFRSPRNPLRMQLGSEFSKSDIVVEYTSRPVLNRLLKMTGQTENQLRADPETEHDVKTMVLDVIAASLHVQLGRVQTIEASIRCESPDSAKNLRDLLNAGTTMLMTVGDNEQLKGELPPDVREIVESKALQDLARAARVELKRKAVEVTFPVPATVLDLARRSAAKLVANVPNASVKPNAGGKLRIGSGALAKEFEWKKGQPDVKMIHRNEGFAFLTGVQGALPTGSEVSILPNPEGNWRIFGTDHFDLAGRAAAVPWFVEAERPVTFKIWRTGEPGFPKLIHQRDGFCVPLKIGGAFNGTGEEFRLRVDQNNGFWRLSARSRARGTRVRVAVVKLKQPGSFDGVAREHSWKNGQKPVRLIHSDDGFAFLSGLSGAFSGGAEYARVRRHEDGYWYLEGRTRQGALTARAMSIQLTKTKRGSD